MFQLRPINPNADFERIANLLKLAWPHITEEDCVQDWLHRPEGAITHYRVAVNDAGSIIGVARVTHHSASKAGEFDLDLVVDERFRKRGAGGKLFDAAFEFIQSQHGALIRMHDDMDCAESEAFAAHRGFVFNRATFTSQLDLATFDEKPFTACIEQVKAQGIMFSSLADFGDTEEARRKDFDINNRSLTPAFEREEPVEGWPSFEEFKKNVCESSWYRADGQIVSIDSASGEWVGLCAIGIELNGNVAFNAYTGVDPHYRGRGIATALKLLGIRCARRHGCISIHTGNDTRNAPMLAINTKLGYVRQGGIRWFERILQVD
jgi:mycothiol synthase